MNHHFYYNNESFRICQLTDIHLDTTENLDRYEKSFDLMRKCITDTHPNLVVITGDLAWGQGTTKAINELCSFFEEMKTPWAPVLGNHDGNANDGEVKSREAFANLLCGYEHCLFERGDKNVQGNGNYIITIGDNESTPEWALFMLDSHEGDFYPSQIGWYNNSSKKLPEKHKELAFFHVPIPEYIEVWDYENCKGFKMEKVCSTHFNDGLFSAMVRSGAMRGVFVGHDHINDYEGVLHGIRLCYGRSSGYQCYGLEGFPVGARIIDLKRGADNFETKIYLHGGKLYEQTTVHRPKLRRN